MTNAAGKSWLTVGALTGGLAVALGAFGAHGLERYVTEKYQGSEKVEVANLMVPLAWKRMHDYNTAAEYQMYHALAVVAVGLLALRGTSRYLQLAGWSFVLGIVLFSGSLYVLVLTGATAWGMVTPFGGTLMILGWVFLALAARGQVSPQ